MSWVSLSMRSPYNALRFVLARHICTSHYLCLSLFFVNIFSKIIIFLRSHLSETIKAAYKLVIGHFLLLDCEDDAMGL